ncbi:MAG: helix-turn-helix transcriptional regulator, partial [Clostridiales bacterium]|nr:helix-turn-helix transcriptional regulator [Clostridiales bacterium]
YIRGTGKIRVFARRSPSKLVEAFARIFPVPFRNFGICSRGDAILTISDQIRALCARLNINLAELARRIGCSPQNLNNKMKRESFTIKDLDKIAKVAGVSFSHKFIINNTEEI